MRCSQPGEAELRASQDSVSLMPGTIDTRVRQLRALARAVRTSR